MRHVAAIVLTGTVLLAAARVGFAVETLENEKVRAAFDDHGLVSFYDKQRNRALQFSADHWSFIIDHHLVDSQHLRPRRHVREPDSMRYTFREGRFDVDVIYQLKPGWRFLTKQLFLTNRSEEIYTVRHVDVVHGHLDHAPQQIVTAGLGEKARKTRRLGDYAAFVRLGDRWGGMFLLQNPFMQWKYEDGDFSMDYRADMTWRNDYGPFASDRACMGTYDLTGYLSPAGVSHRASWLLEPEWSQDDRTIDMGEIEAVTDCVRAFLLYRPKKGVRIHVPWCENDYQIDVATEDGVAQFKRIVDMASALGVEHMLYTVRNEEIALQDEASDAWHWEHVLWLNMGIQIRRNQWDPKEDKLPRKTKELMDYARSKHVQMMAYVYPTLAFEQNKNWLTRRHVHQERLAANLGFREYQDWLIDNLVGFVKNTGISGYAFDYWGLRSPGTSTYAQWYGTRRVLEELRRRVPEIVIDGRQSYHGYGPWTWLGGSYPHPTGGDEQPESFEPFPDLHFDRSSATQQRLTSYWYRNVQFCPTELMPGFIGHQTARKNAQGQVIYNADFNLRDWDDLGWKFSLFSSIATAPFAHCFSMIPARDRREFELFLQDTESQQFLRRWLEWTDDNADILRNLRPIIGPPAIGRADGTAAIDRGHGYLFLFNPNHRKIEAQFKLDASIGLTDGEKFILKQLYPEEGKLLGAPDKAVFNFGDDCCFLMDGTTAWVLEVQPFQESSRPLLFDVRGKAEVQGNELILSKVTGEMGTAVDAQVLLPNTMTIANVTANGRNVAFHQQGRVVTVPCRFAGTYFSHNHAATHYDASFAGRTVNAEFAVPQRIFDQLKKRRAKWPIDWTDNDLQCTWLAPERLLLYVQLAEPDWKMNVSLKLNGRSMDVKNAYSSRTPGMLQLGKGHNTFTGFYVDVSHLEPDQTYQLEATLPPALKPGQFQGIFFENVETEYTERLAGE